MVELSTADGDAVAANAPLRVVSWNLNHWQQPMLPSDTRRDAWQHLRALGAGVVLGQEVVPPPDLAATSAVYGEIGGHRTWGSAVVALDDSLAIEPLRSVRIPYSRRHYLLAGSNPGAVAVARLSVADIQSIVLVSLYGLFDGPVVGNVLRAVADLVPLFDSAAGSRVILGGDFNVSTATTDRKQLDRAEAVFAAVRALGLVEAKTLVTEPPAAPADCPCAAPSTCRHIATWGQAELDQLFVSSSLADQVVALTADPTAIELGLSDHVPLILDLSLSPTRNAHVWDEESFAEEIGRRHGDAARDVIEKLVNWADQKERELTSATGVRTRGLTRFPTNGITIEPELWWQLDLDLEPRASQSIMSIRASGDVVVQFGRMRHPPFDTDEGRNELRLALNEIAGVEILEESLRGDPTFPLAILTDPANLMRLVAVLDRVAVETTPRP
jgi:hypothetical protein